MDPMSLTMGTKSASAGMYAVPAAPGPTIAATCGTTPDMITCSRNKCPEPANREIMSGCVDPGSMRAPPESIHQTMGQREARAMWRRRVTFSSPV